MLVRRLAKNLKKDSESNDLGNLLTLIVLNRRSMHKSGLNNLLQGLAISDLLAPTIACIPHIIYYYGPRTNNHVIDLVNVYIMPVATGATFCSNWTGESELGILQSNFLASLLRAFV